MFSLQPYWSNPSNTSIQRVRQLKRKTKSYPRQLPLIPSTPQSQALQNSQTEITAPEQATVKDNLQEILMSLEGDNRLFLRKIKEQAVVLQKLIGEWESKAYVVKTKVRQLSSAKEARVLLNTLTRRKSEISKLRIQLALFESNLLTAERMEKKRMEPHAFMLSTVDLELQSQRVYTLELEDQLDHKTLDFNNAQKEIQEMNTLILSKQEELWRLHESLDSLEKCGLESSFSLQSSPSDKEMASLQSLLASERQRNTLLQQKLAQQVRPVFPSLYEQVHKKKVFTIILQRDAESDTLGFQVRVVTRSLLSDVSNIVIQQVMKSSLPLEVGDMILEVNGLLSWSTDNTKALHVLNETTGPLKLVLVRDEFFPSPTPPIASHNNLVQLQKSLKAVTIEKESKSKEVQELHLLAAELQDRVDKSKEIEDDLKRKLDKMETRLSQLLSTNEMTSETLKKSDAQNSDLKVELKQLTSQLDISAKQLKEKELTEDDLKQRVSALESEMESIRLDKEKVEKQLAIENSQKKRFQEKLSEANYTATIEKEKHMNELSKLNQQFNIKFDMLTEEVDGLNAELSREKEMSQASNNDTMKQLKENEAKLEDQLKQSSQLMTKLQNYEEQIQVLKMNLDTQTKQLQETLAEAERDLTAHKLEIQSYEEQVLEMKEQSTNLWSENDKLKADIDDLNSQLSSEKNTNRELLSRLGDLEDELKQTIILNKNCNEQIEMLTVKADLEKTKLSDPQKKLSDSESETTTSKLEINAQKEQLQGITQQNAELGSETSELKMQIESLDAELTQEREVNHQLLETNADVQRKLDETKTKLQTEQQQTSQLKKEVEDYKEKVQMLSQSVNSEKENQIVISKRAQEREKVLEKEKTELADKIEKFQTQVDSFEVQLKKEKDVLLLQLEEQRKENEKSLLETKQELKEAVDKFKAQLDTLNAQLVEQNNDLLTASSTIQIYEERLSTADQENANLRSDISSLKEQVDRLKEKEVSALHELEEEKQMKEKLMLKSKQELDQINQFETQIVSLNTQLKEKENAANMKSHGYEEQILKLDQETTELRVTINGFKMQIESLNAQLKEKENELSVANSKIKSNEELTSKLNQEIMAFCADINELKTQIDNFQAELREKEKEVSATNEKILDYEEQLLQVNKTKHGLNSELDDLKMKVDDLNAQLTTERQVKDTKLHELEEERSASLKMKVSNTELSGELNELRAEIESLRVQMSARENDTTSKIQDYEEQLLKLDKEKANLSKEVDDLKFQVDCLHTQLTTEKEEKEATLLKLEEEKKINGEKMKQSNTEGRNEVNNLKAQIESLNAQLNEKEKESLLTTLKIQDYETQLKEVDQEKVELNSQLVEIKAQVCSLNDKLMKEREEKDTTLQKFEDEQKIKEDLLSETKATFNSDVEKLQHDLDTCKNELALTKGMLSDAEMKMQVQNQQNTDLSNELEKFKAQIDNLNSELARVRQEKNTELQELKKINDTTRETEIKLKDELESMSQVNNDYKKKIEMITSDVTTEREELQHKLSEIDKEAKLKTQMYEKQLLDIKQQNTNLRDEIETVKGKLDRLNDEDIKEKEETGAKLKELNDDKTIVLEKLVDAQSQLEENEKEEKKLKIKINDLEDKLQTQHVKSEADLQQLKDKHHSEILEFEAKLQTLERNNQYQQKLLNASVTDIGSKLAIYEGENNRLHKYLEKLLAVVMEKQPSLLEEVSRLE